MAMGALQDLNAKVAPTMQGHALYYVLGLAIAVATGFALGSAMAKEQRNPKILPIAIALSVVVGLFLGYALDTFAAFARASATMP